MQTPEHPKKKRTTLMRSKIIDSVKIVDQMIIVNTICVTATQILFETSSESN